MKWDKWKRSFEHQTGVILKLCTGKNSNKEARIGVLKMGAQVEKYTVGWRAIYILASEEGNLDTRKVMELKKHTI